LQKQKFPCIQKKSLLVSLFIAYPNLLGKKGYVVVVVVVVVVLVSLFISPKHKSS